MALIKKLRHFEHHNPTQGGGGGGGGGGGSRGHMKMNIPYFQMQKQISKTERVGKMGKFFSSCAVVLKLPKQKIFFAILWRPQQNF